MERPAKRQKISQHLSFPVPTRTIALESFQRQRVKRSPGKIVLPRTPDATVTAAIVEVAVNEGSTAVQVAVSTGDVAVTLPSLGTVTVPGIETSSTSTPSSQSSQSTNAIHSAASSSHASSSSLAETLQPSGSGSNSTLASVSSAFSTDHTVTVTATSTFSVSFTNGTFITPSTSYKSSPTDSSGSSNDNSSDSSTNDSSADSSSSGTYVFGQGVTYTATSTLSTGTSYSTLPNGSVIPVAGATITDSSASPTSSSNNSDGGSGGGIPPLTPQQTQMVGGIVGGVAGIAMVLVIVLYVMRWYRQRLKLQGRLPEQLASGNHSRDFGNAALVGMAAPMSQSRTSLFPVSAKKWRPGSGMTVLTNSTTNTNGTDSEKGFQRVSGRKIPSVLSTGGDQYGGSYGAFEKEIGGVVFPQTPTRAMPFANSHKHDLSQSTFYADEDGTYIGSSSHDRSVSRSAPTSPLYPKVFSEDARPRRPSQPTRSPLTRGPSTTDKKDFAVEDFNRALNRNMAAMNKPDGFAISRNSPARTPVIQSPSTSTLRLPIQAPVSMDEDIPEMPLPSPGIQYGQAMSPGLGMGMEMRLGHGYDQSRQRMPSRLGSRNSGKFKEEGL